MVIDEAVLRKVVPALEYHPRRFYSTAAAKAVRWNVRLCSPSVGGEARLQGLAAMIAGPFGEADTAASLLER